MDIEKIKVYFVDRAVQHLPYHLLELLKFKEGTFFLCMNTSILPPLGWKSWVTAKVEKMWENDSNEEKKIGDDKG